jgi:hypothetical protein
MHFHAWYDRFISGLSIARQKVRNSKQKVRRSTPQVVKVAGEVVALDPNCWLPAPKVRNHLGGISPVTFWRWRHDPHLGFPPGRRINGRWYFQWGPVADWHAKQAEAA